MVGASTAAADKSSEGFLGKLMAGPGRSKRRKRARVYVRGTLLHGERKNVEPMAVRLGESDQDLRHLVRNQQLPAVMNV